MYKKGNKIMAGLLALIMLVANVATTGQVIAADLQLGAQNNSKGHANVEFDSYFLNGETTSYEATKNIGEENKIVAQISVKDAGYLKDARVEFVDSNFNVLNVASTEKVANIENNTITLNQIDKDENVIVELPFTFEHDAKVDLAQFNKVSMAKLTGTYVDDNGKSHEINKKIKLNLKWTADVEATLSSEVTKYVQYDVNDQKGVLLQVAVKEAIKDNKLPIKESNIEVVIPEINGVKPSNVDVFNNDSNYEFSYDSEAGKLTIITKNEADEKNEIAWTEEAQKEYQITYTYPETAISENEIAINLDMKSEIKLYSYDEKELSADFNQEVTLQDKVGDVVDFKVDSDELVSKGYMYANYDRTEKLETPYTEKVLVNVSLPELVDEITVDMGKDTFTRRETNYDANSYYKNIRMKKSEFVEFFGEDGFIKVYSQDQVLATIDNSLEDENIVIELNADEIKVVTSKPIKSGELALEFDKAIKGEIVNTQEQLKNTESINTQVNAKVKTGDVLIVDKTAGSSTSLVEPVLQAELTLNNTNLSTVVTNENVELRAILKTNSEYNKLFKNPTIVVDLPSYIENINIKNVQLLFDDELVIKQFRLDGNKIIIETEGTQTIYNIDSVYRGTNIAITADLTTNKLTPNKQDKVVMTVTSKGETIQSEVDISYVAPSGVVTVNKIANYVDGQELMALTNNESGTLEVQAAARTVDAEIEVINNYDNKIDNVVILGRTLAEDATNPETGENLGSNLTAPMVSSINGLEDATVYYSQNSSATTDLNKPENEWTTDVDNIGQMKSYMVVLPNAMETGDSIEFDYQMEIPEDLNYSETATSMYTVYFNNVQEDQTLSDRATSRALTLSTGEAPELEVTLSSYIDENSVVRQGEYVKYIATIKNVGSVDAENVKLNVTAPSESGTNYSFRTKHVEYKEEYYFTGYEEIEGEVRTIEVGQIKSGEQKQVEYEIKIDSVANALNDMQCDLITTAKVIADKMQKEVESNEYKLVLKNALLLLYVRSQTQRDMVLTKGDTLNYTIKVNPKTNLDNVVITAEIPQGLNIQSVDVENIAYAVGTNGPNNLNVQKQINNNIVTITIDKLVTADTAQCTIQTQVDTALGTVAPKVTATVDNEIHNGNTVTNTIEELNITVKQNSLDNPYVKEQEQFAIEYEVSNTSNVFCKDFNLESQIPDGLKLVEIQSVSNGQTLKINNLAEEENQVKIHNSLIRPGEVIKYKIIVKADKLATGETQKEITTKARIYGTNFDEEVTNEVTVTIEYSKDAHIFDSLNDGNNNGPYNPYNPENPVDPNKKVISGLAWVDKNLDGQRDEDEELLSGVEVRLLSNQTSNVLKTTKTSSKGEYVFNNLDEGEYLVVVVYDDNKYDITDYKKSKVNQSLNSDFINVTMNIDGNERTVAITDTIKLTDTNARNIDIGLYESIKSKLKLDKYISSVTVTYGNTVKTYDYNNTQLAKAEIPANELSNATVIVEYKIVVTNEGAVGNYIKKVVDYIPSGMKFNSELNRDWYQSTNGDLYNSSLANTKLLPGESAELTLTLTKKMTDSNTGIVNNNAEIYEVYNEEGILDKDSTFANKATKEDDMSAADLVIGVKTGDAVIYSIVIAAVISTMIGIGIYYIRKIVLRKM